ncbi:alkaline phosphatase [Helicobacter bilis]|uniref:alkaline phosphatase n=1 Tax=Helicobacter bilis TaxID=37372 RepID=UPI00248E2790|nr:alkaline phosphatase [Helicobacter bilis]
MRFSFNILCALIICSGINFMNAMSNKDITILPINNAKFLAGQRFDFLVEIRDSNLNLANTRVAIRVTINDKNITEYFNKSPKIWRDGDIVSYRIDSVSFNDIGNIKVKVKTPNATRIAQYEVVSQKASRKAKNVILLIGDGMSLQAKQMARILSKGINEGKYNDVLEMEKLDRMALITTSGYDSLTTDSANSASAYATGHKSVVNAMGVYEDSTKNPFDDPKVENIAEILKRQTKKSIGLITTANITDATPAAFVAHTRRRSEQNMIAQSYLDLGVDVLLGGGLQHFIPKEAKGSKRKDSLNLIESYKNVGYEFSSTREELLAQAKSAKKLLGLYHNDNLNVYLDREVLKNPKVLGNFKNQPSLLDMTNVALEVLSKNKSGFFLMIEGASIDKQLHKMDWQRATYDTIEFDKAVKIARDFAAKRGDTFVIVVADHAHGASITGTYHELDGKSGREAVRTYAHSVFPTFVDNDNDGFPDDPNPEVTLAVQYANHPDYKADYRLKTEPISPTIEHNGKNIANPNMKGETYRGNIPEKEDQEVHAADDVVLMSEGIGSEYFKGVMDNTEVFFAMMRAFGIDGK